MRTIVELPGDQLSHLDAHCRRERISRAEAIRQAVALLLADASRAQAARAFGLWRGRSDEALGKLERLRGEWQ